MLVTTKTRFDRNEEKVLGRNDGKGRRVPITPANCTISFLEEKKAREMRLRKSTI